MCTIVYQKTYACLYLCNIGMPPKKYRDMFPTLESSLRKYIIIYIASVSIAGRSAAATFIVPQNTVLSVLAMGMEELGPVQLILMLGDAVPPKIDWLARKGLLHDTHTCMQCHVTSGGIAGRPGRVSVLVSAVQRTNKCTEAGLNRGSLFGFCSRGRRTCHRTTWRDTWVSRLGRGHAATVGAARCGRQRRASDRRRARRVLTL